MTNEKKETASETAKRLIEENKKVDLKEGEVKPTLTDPKASDVSSDKTQSDKRTDLEKAEAKPTLTDPKPPSDTTQSDNSSKEPKKQGE